MRDVPVFSQRFTNLSQLRRKNRTARVQGVGIVL
jgi:hypothetical protein